MAYTRALGLAANPILFIFPVFQWVPTAGNRLLHRYLRAIDDMVAKILADKRAERSATEVDSAKDLLDMILASVEDRELVTKKLSDQELHNNVFLFFLAGHETSSTTLTMALYLLAQHPEVQERARAEAMNVLGDVSDDVVEPGSLHDLHFCTAVLKETPTLSPRARHHTSSLPSRCAFGSVFDPSWHHCVHLRSRGSS